MTYARTGITLNAEEGALGSPFDEEGPISASHYSPFILTIIICRVLCTVSRSISDRSDALAGRVMLTDHGSFLLFNVYFPNAARVSLCSFSFSLKSLHRKLSLSLTLLFIRWRRERRGASTSWISMRRFRKNASPSSRRGGTSLPSESTHFFFFLYFFFSFLSLCVQTLRFTFDSYNTAHNDIDVWESTLGPVVRPLLLFFV